MTLTVLGTRIEYNEVNEHGSAIFFVSNDHTGNIVVEGSVITNNIGGYWYPAYDGISMHSDTPITVTDLVIENNSKNKQACRPGSYHRESARHPLLLLQDLLKGLDHFGFHPF